MKPLVLFQSCINPANNNNNNNNNDNDNNDDNALTIVDKNIKHHLYLLLFRGIVFVFPLLWNNSSVSLIQYNCCCCCYCCCLF